MTHFSGGIIGGLRMYRESEKRRGGVGITQETHRFNQEILKKMKLITA